jgi:hypothetical protein
MGIFQGYQEMNHERRGKQWGHQIHDRNGQQPRDQQPSHEEA